MNIEPTAILYDLKSSDVDSSSSDLADLMRARGWSADKSPRQQFNEWSCWGITVQRMALEYLDHRPHLKP